MATSKKTPGLGDTTNKTKSSKTGGVTTSKKSKEYTIKYEDKSGGQPELIPIFNSIKALMKPYAKGTIKEKGESGGIYNLVSDKPVEIEGKRRDELYFASIIVQKGYVGFYFTPVYGSGNEKETFNPALLKYLKGKSCFHISKNDPQIFGYIKEALKIGYYAYKQKGWL